MTESSQYRKTPGEMKSGAPKAGSSAITGIQQAILSTGFLQTNRFVVEITPPFGLDMSLRSVDTESGNRSFISVGGKNNPQALQNMQFRCSSVTAPGVSVATTPYRVYGPVRQMPYEIIYGGEVSVTYILSRDMQERAFFENWLNLIIDPKNYKINFYDNYISEMKIHILDRSDAIVYTSLVEEAYPKMIGDIAMGNDKENEYITQEITFVFRKYTSNYLASRENLDDSKNKIVKDKHAEASAKVRSDMAQEEKDAAAMQRGYSRQSDMPGYVTPKPKRGLFDIFKK